MSWHYRAPNAFPAIYITTLRQAAANPSAPIVFHSSASRADVEIIAERFRWFKWCVKQDESSTELLKILNTYDIRSLIKEDEVGYILWITAKPTKLSEFVRLNPILANEMLSIVNE